MLHMMIPTFCSKTAGRWEKQVAGQTRELPWVIPFRLFSLLFAVGSCCSRLGRGVVSELLHENLLAPGKGSSTMSFKEAVREMSRDERFKATVSAMNTLLIQKGVYTQEEFEAYFCQWAEAKTRRHHATQGVFRRIKNWVIPARVSSFHST